MKDWTNWTREKKVKFLNDVEAGRIAPQDVQGIKVYFLRQEAGTGIYVDEETGKHYTEAEAKALKSKNSCVIVWEETVQHEK